MKKLIDELELECADMSRSNCDYGELSGFAAAVDIVRAHNPWHEVTELPPRRIDSDTLNSEYSIDVYTTDGFNTSCGCYDYMNGEWYTDADLIPTHWAYLPEVVK